MPYSSILQRKECQEVLTGQRFEWDNQQRAKITQLEKIQTTIFLQEKFDTWQKIEEQINTIRKSLQENIEWETMITQWSLQ